MNNERSECCIIIPNLKRPLNEFINNFEFFFFEI